MIHEMKKRGMNISQIAHELGRDRKTIRKICSAPNRLLTSVVSGGRASWIHSKTISVVAWKKGVSTPT